ncbi:MAG: M18 family aminopeptidase [Oscillospiraceae bacterium]|nr:M18 family aminopeptidase [Oscillospiraceae bacterium]
MNDINRGLLDFIAASPTAFHAADNIEKELIAAGFERLCEGHDWHITLPGKYYVVRNGSSVIALDLPEKVDGFLLTAAHADSPSFRLREKPELESAGAYTRLSVEKYGGMLCSTWMDRPLGVAGRVVVRENGRAVTKLVWLDRDLLLIPSVAIHMDRSANDGKAFNANEDMLPLFAVSGENMRLDALLAKELGCAEEDILSRELNLCLRERGCVWGPEGEFVSAPQLDDLQCVYACLKAFLQPKTLHKAAVFCAMDNEEVGSKTRQGADSSFLEDVLIRVSDALGKTRAQYRTMLAQSFMVSADNAHAVHPNHPEYADRVDRPVLNGGIVIKYNANQRYITDAVSAAVFSEVCRKAGVPVQRYTNRPDIHGGVTMGNISLSHVSIRSLDVGLAQLAMHSAYETAGARDTEYLIRAAAAFFGSAYCVTPDGIEI